MKHLLDEVDAVWFNQGLIDDVDLKRARFPGLGIDQCDRQRLSWGISLVVICEPAEIQTAFSAGYGKE